MSATVCGCGAPCAWAGRAGPCWGRVELVDEWTGGPPDYYEYEDHACEGHVDMATAQDGKYTPEPAPLDTSHAGGDTP